MATQTQAPANVGAFSKFKRFLREVKAELKKVSWPTKKELWANTITVAVAVLMACLIIWCFDFVLAKFMHLILR